MSNLKDCVVVLHRLNNDLLNQYKNKNPHCEKSKRKRTKKLDRDYVYIYGDNVNIKIDKISDNKIKLLETNKCHICLVNYDDKITHFSDKHLNDYYICPLCNESLNENKQPKIPGYEFFIAHLFTHHIDKAKNVADCLTLRDKINGMFRLLDISDFIIISKSESIKIGEEIIRSSVEHQNSCKTKKKKKLNGNLDMGKIKSETDLNCEICNKSFVHDGHLTRHLSHFHMDQTKSYFICSICNTHSEIINNTGGMMPHHHLIEPLNTIQTKSMNFNTVQELKDHYMEYHPDYINKFQKHSFNSLLTFQKKHLCEQCGMSYIDRKALERHRVRAHLLTPDSCVFSENEMLIPATSLQDELIFHCPLEKCGKTFATKFHLTIHIKKFHPHLQARFSRQKHETSNGRLNKPNLENHKFEHSDILDEKTGNFLVPQHPFVTEIEGKVGSSFVDLSSMLFDGDKPISASFDMLDSELRDNILEISPNSYMTQFRPTDFHGKTSLSAPLNSTTSTLESSLLNLDPETLASLTPEQILYFNKATANVNAYDPANKPQFYCETCHESYNDRHSLVKHVRHFHEEKSYACYICGRAYYQKPHLNRHLASSIHADVLPFQCVYCGKRFPAFHTLRKHVVDMFYHRDPTLLSTPKFMCHLCTPPEAFLPPGWDFCAYVGDVNNLLCNERMAVLEVEKMTTTTPTTTNLRIQSERLVDTFMTVSVGDDDNNKDQQHRDIVNRIMRETLDLDNQIICPNFMGPSRPEEANQLTTNEAVKYPTPDTDYGVPLIKEPSSVVLMPGKKFLPDVGDDYNMNHDLEALENYFDPYVPIIPPSFDPTSITRDNRPPPIKIIRFPNIKELLIHYKKFHPDFDPLVLPDGTGLGPIKINQQGFPDRPLPRLLPPFMNFGDNVDIKDLQNGNFGRQTPTDIVKIKPEFADVIVENQQFMGNSVYILDTMSGQIIQAQTGNLNVGESFEGATPYASISNSQLQILMANNNNKSDNHFTDNLNHQVTRAPGKVLSIPDPCAFVHLCEFCGKTFTYNKTLKEHIKKMHDFQNQDGKKTTLTYRAGALRKVNQASFSSNEHVSDKFSENLLLPNMQNNQFLSYNTELFDPLNKNYNFLVSDSNQTDNDKFLFNEGTPLHLNMNPNYDLHPSSSASHHFIDDMATEHGLVSEGSIDNFRMA